MAGDSKTGRCHGSDQRAISREGTARCSQSFRENISAAEVEGVLCEHPAVRAAAVVPVPDDLRGEEVKAFIQLQNGATLDPEELLAFAQKKLAAFKMPRFIEFVEKFPLTPSERIAKHELLKSKPDQRKGAYDAIIKQWG